MEFPYIYPPLFKGRAKQPSPYIPVLLEHKGNGHYIEGLVDSGADVSAIAESLAAILDIPLDGPETTLTGLGSEVKGRSAQVELIVENGSVKYSTNEVFFVMKDDDINLPLILGRDSIFQHFRITFDERARMVVLDRYLCK